MENTNNGGSKVNPGVTAEIAYDVNELAERPDLLEETAHLLARTWKSSSNERLRNMELEIQREIQIKKSFTFDADAKISAKARRSLLPKRWVLTATWNDLNKLTQQQQQAVIGHAQMKLGLKNRQRGRSCVIFALVISKSWRKLGLGRLLMNHLEREAQNMNIHYVFLNTSEYLHRKFYSKCGYEIHHERVAVKRKVFKGIKTSQIENLEDLFSRAHSKYRKGNCERTTTTESIDVDKGDVPGIEDEKRLVIEHKSKAKNALWLRKRICNRFFIQRSFQFVKPAERQKIVLDRVLNLKNKMSRNQTVNMSMLMPQESSKTKFVAFLNHSFPSISQIGPSCGLCALLMVFARNDIHTEYSDDGDRFESEAVTSSFQNFGGLPVNLLLQTARKEGYTSQGEMFDINHLLELAKKVLPEKRRSLSMNVNIQKAKALHVLSWIAMGGAIIIPYDSSPGNCEPCIRKGKRAHYAVLIGFVFPSRYSKQIKHVAKNLAEDVETQTKILHGEKYNEKFVISWHHPELAGELEREKNLSDLSEDTKYDVEEENRIRDALVVVAQHSASKQPIVVPYSLFLRSNAQVQRQKCLNSRWKIGTDGSNLANTALFLY